MYGAVDHQRLVDAAAAGPFDPHARMLRRVVVCDEVLITLHAGDDLHLLGHSDTRSETPADPEHRVRPRRGRTRDTLCERVITDDAPLQVDDVDPDPDLTSHADLAVRAYLGWPLHDRRGTPIGTVCALSHSPRPWSDRDVEAVASVRDLAQGELRPMLDAGLARERAEEISLLLSTLRHELGGELGIVLGGIETAMLDQLDEAMRNQVLRNARRECRRVIDTLDALLRMDVRAPLQLDTVDIGDVVRESVDSGDERITQRLVLDLEPVAATTEPVLVAHIVRNLVDNAHKYSDGPIEVHTGTGELGLPYVTVRDHGCGMPEAAIQQLFTPFSRQHDDHGVSGFGLGLAIVRALVDRLEAELVVDSGPDGTTMRLVLAAVEAPAQSPKPSKAASSSEGA